MPIIHTTQPEMLTKAVICNFITELKIARCITANRANQFMHPVSIMNWFWALSQQGMDVEYS